MFRQDLDDLELRESLDAVECRIRDLPEELQAHIQRARQVGRELSEATRTDPDRVDLALAAHDLFRAETPETLLSEASRRGWETDPVERAGPMLLHGPVAGLWLMQEAGVQDPAVLESVTWHTTYAPQMGPVGAAVFLADKLDPDKIRRKSWLEDVRELAFRGRTERAVDAYLSRLIVQIVESGGIAHTRALDALNWIRAGVEGL